MTMFGIKESEAATLVHTVSSEPLDREATRDRVARAMWSGIIEPGDRTAGLIVTHLGAALALTLVIEGRSPSAVIDALAQTGAGDLGEDAGLVADLAKALARWKPRVVPEATLTALRRAERVGARLLAPQSPDWPGGLDDLGFHAPLALWCRGADGALGALANSIALVGARAATGYGEHVTMEASAGLVDRGYAIVSGAAYGIDGMAHRAALASHGVTVAFLAGGVDRFYPSGHDTLLTRIAESGAVISELPCGEPPTKWRFLQRNRLIAAASRATVVMEAGWRSGSLNTAGHAAALARPLGAVPGPVTSAASAGCHRLIREFDAVCVTNPDEMAELAPLTFDELKPGRFDLDGSSSPANSAEAEAEAEAAARSGSGTAAEAAAAAGSGTEAEAAAGSGTNRVDPRPSRPVSLGDRPPVQLRVLDALSARSPRTVVDVAARCGLSVATVQATLGLLQLEQKVIERETGWAVVPRGRE
ncbi:DNA processing protein [Glaciihabitans tibetensis]|uniref:DNA processing protein n=1 Tax=Glaciihabitans tibetensis TaxID=1266600 RepID=A0A2T0VIB1_9MICO|nr:DNA-processing protein DprA [Glaciihabitans tibetensis]PRY69948.1 DNA processing protein [Glaciihabitans tibetensis]